MRLAVWRGDWFPLLTEDAMEHRGEVRRCGRLRMFTGVDGNHHAITLRNDPLLNHVGFSAV